MTLNEPEAAIELDLSDRPLTTHRRHFIPAKSLAIQPCTYFHFNLEAGISRRGILASVFYVCLAVNLQPR